MIKRLLSVLLGLTILLSPSVALAQGETTTTEPSAKKSATTAATTAQTELLARIKTKGKAEIDRRIESLNKVQTKVTAAEKLTAEQKTALTNELNKQKSGLTELKTKLEAATTVEEAKAVVTSMVSDYRTYALVLPKVWLVTAAEGQAKVELRLETLVGKFQTRIAEAKAKGKNTSGLETALANLKAKLKAAETTTNAVGEKALTLKATDYNADHAVVADQLAQLKAAQTNIAAAVAEAKTIVTDLKAL